MTPMPEMLSHSSYCYECFQAHVQPELNTYNETLEKAKDVYVFYRTQGKETSLYKRSHPPVRVADALDEADALMRLAFMTVRSDCNAIVDVDLKSKKIRNHAYQTTRWDGMGNPVQVDAEKLDRAEALRRYLQSR